MAKYNAKDDPEIHDSLPKELMSISTRLLPLSCKVILARLWVLSRRGENTVEMSDSMIANTYGLTINGVNKSFKFLEEQGYIETRVGMSELQRNKKARFVTWKYISKSNGVVFSDKTKSNGVVLPNPTELDNQIQQSCISSIYKNEYKNEIREREQSPLSNPPSFEDIFVLFQKGIEKLKGPYPAVENVDAELSARKYLNHRIKNDAFKKLKTELQLQADINNWLLKEPEFKGDKTRPAKNGNGGLKSLEIISGILTGCSDQNGNYDQSVVSDVKRITSRNIN